MERHIRKLMKMSSHSFALVIPKSLVKKFGWKEKQKLSIEEGERKSLKIRDWKRE